MTNEHDLATHRPSLPDEDESLARRLRSERPAPRPGWRGELRRSLLAGPVPPPRPRRLRLLIAAYGCSGMALLGLAAIGI
jgi:hypothetical protein